MVVLADSSGLDAWRFSENKLKGSTTDKDSSDWPLLTLSLVPQTATYFPSASRIRSTELRKNLAVYCTIEVTFSK
ncbi:hypothetical protein LENED_002792 [Lentinula edodes]|uniref:Uncharacterized protein n=1 Tax=Lentinula edodes TaxID=5353 RepID=A0A1Q3E208_LENED|nr:hypothetical protein LENED_002792 [Lentinula edodes]